MDQLAGRLSPTRGLGRACRSALGIASALLILGAGCSKRGPLELKEAPITGSKTDPAVELAVVWQDKHQYEVSLQLEQGTTVRNRNTDDEFDQDIRLRLDFYATPRPAKRPEDRWLDMDLTGFLFTHFRDAAPMVHYDTRSRVAMLSDDQRTTEIMDKLVGARWRFLMTPSGAITGAESDTNTPSAKALNTDANAAGVALLKRLFHPQFFRPFIEFSVLPKTSVQVGSKWDLERTMSAGTVGSVQFKGQAEFRGWQMHQGKKCARIDFDGELSPLKGLAAQLSRAVRANAALEDGRMRGSAWVDTENKVPVELITDLHLMTSTVFRSRRPQEPGATNSPQPVRIQVPLSQRFKLRVSDLGELPQR